MVFGYQQIDWLTPDETKVLDIFPELMTYCGTMVGTKQMKHFTIIFFTLLYVPIATASFWAGIHYQDKVDILAYSLHHTVLISLAYLAVCIIIPVFRVQYNFLLDGTRKTYNYDSELVNNYARELLNKRIPISRLAGKIIYIMTIGILIEIQIFFAVEAIWFQSYKTLFPVYIYGLDLDDTLVFLSVVLVQETIMYYTANLPVLLFAISYSAWSHLDLEMKILIFAITNVEKIVKERREKRSLEESDNRKLAEIYESYCRHFAKHHGCIITYFEAYSQAVSIITTLMFTTGFIMFVLVGLATMSDNLGVKLKLFWFLLFQLIVTFVWCWIGQYIGGKSEEISEAVMGSPWWLLPKKCHSTLLLIMVRCRRPLVLKTSFGQLANMESFMDMMKAVFQFVSVLYQVTTGENKK